ncbi:hypothetical protein [Streptomyces sp. NBC_00847]|uniref:hypothetical protein n=1 Tax=Streptomyces sp. NBC_00847 TaxID=2975850 RepID=UPI00224CF5A4|nr:hypothetical protein [Streptomyces sp. NBC_00847]MCX4880354.1 hypothetical protein [Streptomyces sp. NBC_00847]
MKRLSTLAAATIGAATLVAVTATSATADTKVGGFQPDKVGSKVRGVGTYNLDDPGKVCTQLFFTPPIPQPTGPKATKCVTVTPEGTGSIVVSTDGITGVWYTVTTAYNKRGNQIAQESSKGSFWRFD